MREATCAFALLAEMVRIDNFSVYGIRNITPRQEQETTMVSTNDAPTARERFIQAVVTKTGRTADEALAGLVWVDGAMILSRFNMYHQQDKVAKHLLLAVSAPAEEIPFSLEAHGFQPLPCEHAPEHMVAVIRELLADADLLREHVEALPSM